jgi:methionine synthase I (cobalamin-dependent)
MRSDSLSDVPAARPALCQRSEVFADEMRVPLVLDAAMGTRLLERGLNLGSDDPSLWNLHRPEEVADVHRRDVDAGAGAILTNTFGANRIWLDRFGSRDHVVEINRAATRIARSAAGEARLVFGDVGPSAGIELFAVLEQVAALVDAGVDALLFETFRASEALPVIRAITAKGTIRVPILVSLWEWPDPPGPVARSLVDAGASVIGMNCRRGIGEALRFANRLAGELDLPLLVKPSAGVPANDDESPEGFAALVPELFARNVRFFGGCCGTTEQHTKALALACCGALAH